MGSEKTGPNIELGPQTDEEGAELARKLQEEGEEPIPVQPDPPGAEDENEK